MYPWPKKLTSLSWHYEGKQFVASCADGSLVTWNIKPVGRKPASVLFPHREKGADSSEPLAPIDKVGGKGAQYSQMHQESSSSLRTMTRQLLKEIGKIPVFFLIILWLKHS